MKYVCHTHDCKNYKNDCASCSPTVCIIDIRHTVGICMSMIGMPTGPQVTASAAPFRSIIYDIPSALQLGDLKAK